MIATRFTPGGTSRLKLNFRHYSVSLEETYFVAILAKDDFYVWQYSSALCCTSASEVVVRFPDTVDRSVMALF